MDGRVEVRTEPRLVDICPRCEGEVERCHFCGAPARYFVSPPLDHRSHRDLFVCERHRVLLNVEEDEFRDEVAQRLASGPWELGWYVPKDGRPCERH